MVEADEDLLDVFWHRHVDSAGDVVPSESEATVELVAFPFGGDNVKLVEGVHEVVSVLAAFVLDAKIVFFQNLQV
jgi:hypothetical protein